MTRNRLAAKQRTVVGGFDRRQILNVAFDHVREAFQDLEAPARAERRPVREGALGGGDGGVDLEFSAARDVPQKAFVDGAVRREGSCAVDALVVDEVPSVDTDASNGGEGFGHE